MSLRLVILLTKTQSAKTRAEHAAASRDPGEKPLLAVSVQTRAI